MKILADAAMRSNAIRRFLAAAPTFPEMGVLYRLLDLVRAKRRDGSVEHETIIVDLPATGHGGAPGPQQHYSHTAIHTAQTFRRPGTRSRSRRSLSRSSA